MSLVAKNLEIKCSSAFGIVWREIHKISFSCWLVIYISVTARRAPDNNATSYAIPRDKQLYQAHRNAFCAYIRLSVNENHA